MWYNIYRNKNKGLKSPPELKGAIIMTKAMLRKVMKAIEDFRNEHPGECIHGCYFHHYGDDYRIESNYSPSGVEETEFEIYRVCTTDIHDTLCGTINACDFYTWEGKHHE
jgi:hypothetical protein